MGKAGKAKRALKRKEARKAAKAHRKALYLSYAEAGKSKASRRFTKAKKYVVAMGVDTHPSNCGNPGCKKCYPQYQRKLNAAA